MKLFKNTVYLFTLATIILSCGGGEPNGVGMNTWPGYEDLKFHIGTQDPINTVMEFDSADRSKDYDKMRSMTTDSSKFIGGDGVVKNVEEYFDSLKERDARMDSLKATWSWKTTAIFSVDIAPGEGGELVHNYWDGIYTEGDSENNVRGMEMWYVVNGKVVQVTTYFQDIPEEDEE